jgi:hypothetical protein
VIWAFINIATSVIVALIVAYKLIFMSMKLRLAERVGLGLLGAGMVLNIAPIIGTGTPFNMITDTPFDDWGSTLLRIGLMLYLYGRISRVWKHDAAQMPHAAGLERELAAIRKDR